MDSEKIIKEIEKVDKVANAIEAAATGSVIATADEAINAAVIIGKTGSLGKDGRAAAEIADFAIKTNLFKRLFGWLLFWR